MTLRRLSTLLIVGGIVLLLEAGLTLLWQEPATAVYARVQQHRLAEEIAQAERSAPPRTPPDLAPAARRAARRLEAGDAVGRLEIPAIGLETVVVEGTDPGELRSGPGHYPGTALPGAGTTVAIAGHRTTYGAPFRRLDDLERGDVITVRMPYGRVVYRVERTRIVDPDAIWVTRPAGREQLVLTACHPLYSAEQRIVVFARGQRA
ncbi:MAG TPA: class E sortase [Solirubrobacteraceae bacterium]|nr:class E sortase [Solirubrobacteraceae bacterium]